MTRVGSLGPCVYALARWYVEAGESDHTVSLGTYYYILLEAKDVD
jgi:hypothetical protein